MIDRPNHSIGGTIIAINIKIDDIFSCSLSKRIGATIKIDKDSTIFIKPAKKLKPINITTLPYPGFPTDLQAQITSLMAITDGISRDGRELLPFMGFSYYAKISEEDLDAIVAYVKTLPPTTAVPAAE